MKSSNEISISEQISSLTDVIDQNNINPIKDKLIELINELINNDFNSLVQLLYRIDVDENTLKQNLKQQEGSDSASIIANMIIERKLQKIEFAKKFAGDKKRPGEDGW